MILYPEYFEKLHEDIHCECPLEEAEVPFRPLQEVDEVEYNPCDFDWNEVYLMQYSKNDVKDGSFFELIKELKQKVYGKKVMDRPSKR